MFLDKDNKIEMKKIIIFPFIVFILLMSSCTSKNIKAEITPYDLVELYSSSQYESFVDDYKNNDSIKYDYSVKVYNSEEESRNYLFVYFFEDDKAANDFYKEYNSKTGFIWLFGLIFGENLNVKYEKYDYMVLEYNNSTSKDMINIYMDFIYE